MKPTDTSERGLESLIVQHLTAHGYVLGNAKDYQADVALDAVQLLAFLQVTQPEAVKTLQLAQDGMPRTQFLHRLQGEISKRGVVDVLRKGVSHGPARLDLYKTLPTPGNDRAAQAFAHNRFSVTRQVRYSTSGATSLDLVIFVNGLPVLTFELKNSLTKQTVHDAVNQYKNTRDAQELLFQSGRCMAHFAVDDNEVQFCPELQGKDSWFLPFNQGYNSGSGNPPNPAGLKTDYLWQDVLAKDALTHLIERFAQVVEEEQQDANTGRITARRMLANASYFAFTATPKRKTLELFGEKTWVDDKPQFRAPPELTYSTKQAIEEGFILDVIAHYTPVQSSYQVAKTVADDPKFDKVRAAFQDYYQTTIQLGETDPNTLHDLQAALYRQYTDHEDFKRFLADTLFYQACQQPLHQTQLSPA